jgi:hypothetical protein
MRPAAPEASKCQLGSADDSHLVLDDPVLVPNSAQSSNPSSMVAVRETFRASGIAGSCYLPRSWVLAAAEVEKPHGLDSACCDSPAAR